MKETPLIFSADSIRAILSGLKTQTRRVMNPQPAHGLRQSPFVPSGVEDGHGREMKLRFAPGDLIWVKETFATRDFGDDNPSIERQQHYTIYRAQSLIGGKWDFV